MNKAELAKKVEEATGFSNENSKMMVETVFDEIANALSAGEIIKIPGFGIFDIKTRDARKGVNPATGEEIDIPERKVVAFHPAKALRDSVN